MSSISSAERAPLASGSNELASLREPSAKAILSAEPCSDITGPTSRYTRTYANSTQIDWVGDPTSSQAVSPANLTAQHHEGVSEQSISGQSSAAWSPSSDPIGWRLRTCLESDMTALTGCAVILSEKVTPSGRSISILRYRRDSVAGFASSGWPTPTETANHDAPSMRKWPAYARYQDAVRRTTARLWEWMMDLPEGWTACISSETPSLQPSPNSSDGPF